jgi:hypothetical protein
MTKLETLVTVRDNLIGILNKHSRNLPFTILEEMVDVLNEVKVAIHYTSFMSQSIPQPEHSVTPQP